MSKPTYPHSRYILAGYPVRRGMFKGYPKAVRNVLKLYWPRFPMSGPDLPLARGTLTAKKWRRANYWARQIRKNNLTTRPT